MRPDTHRKNVQESLDLWAEAEKKQRTLSFDDYGDVHLVYSFAVKNSPKLELDLKQQAVMNVIGKIQTELRVVDDVRQQKTKIETLAKFSVEAGVPQVNRLA